MGFTDTLQENKHYYGSNGLLIFMIICLLITIILIIVFFVIRKNKKTYKKLYVANIGETINGKTNYKASFISTDITPVTPVTQSNGAQSTATPPPTIQTPAPTTTASNYVIYIEEKYKSTEYVVVDSSNKITQYLTPAEYKKEIDDFESNKKMCDNIFIALCVFGSLSVILICVYIYVRVTYKNEISIQKANRNRGIQFAEQKAENKSAAIY